MTKTIKTDNTDELFERLKSSDIFTCTESSTGLRINYHGIVSVIGAPVTRIYKVSENKVKITFSLNIFLIVITLLITLFFWMIAFLAICKETPNIAGVIIALCAPLIMWVLDGFILSKMSKLIVDEIERA